MLKAFQSGEEELVSHSEEQVSWEEAFVAQADGPVSSLQPHCVSTHQLEHRFPGRQVSTPVIEHEAVQHRLIVAHQVNTSSTVGLADEAELIDTGYRTCEQACLRAVVLLVIVDDLTEMNYSLSERVVRPQDDREGRLWECGILVEWRWTSGAWRTRRACRSSQASPAPRASRSYSTWRQTPFLIKLKTSNKTYSLSKIHSSLHRFLAK